MQYYAKQLFVIIHGVDKWEFKFLRDPCEKITLGQFSLRGGNSFVLRMQRTGVKHVSGETFNKRWTTET